MAKDVRLYLDAARAADAPAVVAETTVDIWTRFAAEQPSADFTRIYPFTAGVKCRVENSGLKKPFSLE